MSTESETIRIKAFFCSSSAKWTILLWGIAEAIFFFIVPDVFFMLSALFAPRQGVFHSFISVAGSLIGGSLMFLLTLKEPQVMIGLLVKVPLITPKLVTAVQDALLHDGLSAMFLAPLKGIPYKIYAVQAAHLHFDLVEFLALTIPVRLERVLLLALLGAGVGRIFQKHIAGHARQWVLGYFLLCGLYYGFYAYIMSTKY